MHDAGDHSVGDLADLFLGLPPDHLQNVGQTTAGIASFP